MPVETKKSPEDVAAEKAAAENKDTKEEAAKPLTAEEIAYLRQNVLV